VTSPGRRPRTKQAKQQPQQAAARPAMAAWMRSLFSPLKKLWIRMHSAHSKSTCPASPPSTPPLSFLFQLALVFSLVAGSFHSMQSTHPCSDCVVMSRKGHLHPVRGRQVVPLRGRAHPLVHPRRLVPLPPAADAPRPSLTRSSLPPSGLRPPRPPRRPRHKETVGVCTYKKMTTSAGRYSFTFFSRDTCGLYLIHGDGVRRR
jgi:hypothetical protein